MTHDVLGRRHAVHHRQMHVQRDDVGGEACGTARSRSRPLPPSATTSSPRVRANDFHEAFAHRNRVFYDQNPDFRHVQLINPRIRSSRSVWLNSRFSICATAPASRPRCRSSGDAREVTRIAGTSRCSGSLRVRSMKVKPSIPGISTSTKNNAYLRSFAFSIASSPETRQIHFVTSGLENALLEHARRERIVDHEDGRAAWRRDSRRCRALPGFADQTLGAEHELRIAFGVERCPRDHRRQQRQFRDTASHHILDAEQAIGPQCDQPVFRLDQYRRTDRAYPSLSAVAAEQTLQGHVGDHLSVEQNRVAVRAMRNVLRQLARRASHRAERDRDDLPAHLEQQGRQRRQGHRQHERQGGAARPSAFERDPTRELFHDLSDQIEANATTGDAGDRSCRADPSFEQQLAKPFGVETSQGMSLDAPTLRAAANGLEIQAAAVVCTGEDDVLVATRHAGPSPTPTAGLF